MGDDGSTFLATLRRKRQQGEAEIEALKAQLEAVERELASERARLGIPDPSEDKDAVVATACKRFNTSAKKGIEFLRSSGYFGQGGTAREVATFLLEQGQTLSKAHIGEYLGENKEFNLKVLDEFVALHEFTGMEFDTALRGYLWDFRLPGESQKIDRMMEAFARRYCDCNPGQFHTADGCYILAFSTIMLNTSLHNPAVANKTGLDQFIVMNRGVDGGKDIPEESLRRLYHSIEQDPFKIPGDEAGLSITFFNPEREGWLIKEGGSSKNWKRRWVVLNNSCLYYFKSQTDETPCGIVPLENVRCEVPEKYKKKKGEYYFELLGQLDEHGVVSVIKGCKTNSKGMVVQGKHTRYLFKCEDETEAADWVRCIKAAVKRDAFYDLYSNRKAHIQQDMIFEEPED